MEGRGGTPQGHCEPPGSLLKMQAEEMHLCPDGETSLEKDSMFKKFGECFGLASLILVMSYGDLLGGGWDVRMHVPYALDRIVWAQLTDIALLGLALFAIVGPLSRTRLRPWVQLLLSLFAPPSLLWLMRAQIPSPLTSGILLMMAGLWTSLVLLLLLLFQPWYQRLMRLGEIVGIFAAVFCLCSMTQLLWVLHWKPGAQQHGVAWAATPQPPRRHARVVWVILDELAYEQVYGQRADDLQLPNFDALRKRSTVYTDVQPIGEKTVKIIPSLFWGHVISKFRYTFDNRFLVHGRDTVGYTDLADSDTVFTDAQRAGWRTAVVGWYNPYCSYLGGAVDDCYWMNLDRLDGPQAQDASYWSNVWSPLKHVAEQMGDPSQAGREMCAYSIRQREKTFADLQARAEAVLKTDQADLIFLHLPVPHSPNIWDRMRGGFTRRCGSSYLDNLALADAELGRILAILERSPRWKDTTLIVQGDHSWRTYLWQGRRAWTAEDAQASRSGFDPRPAVIIHHPGQTTGDLVQTPWSVINVHSVVEEALRGSPAQ